MEVFSVFATLSLVDMISGPLDRVKNAMKSVEGGVSSLGRRMGNLALGMAPVALAAGVMLGAFGMATSKAIAFESAMADVAKVVNFESQAEFQGMSDTIRDMAGRIPMAADGIAAIVAAAGQSGVAKEDLTEFAEQAAKMGVAFDLTGDQAGKMMSDWRAGMNLSLPQVYSLADAVNHLSNNMNATAPALGEVIQRVGAVAMVCGLGETQVAALGAAFLSAGASPEIAATALKSFTSTLVKGTAMSKDQAAAFKSLGFSASQLAKDMQTDAQGTIFKVLQAIADKPKELQMSLLTEMFGQESLGAIAPLLQNMGNLSQAFELVGDKANYAGSMQAEFDTRSKTVANALQLLSNKLTNLAISVGNAFLPSIGWAAEKLGVFVDVLRAAADTKAGQWLLQLAGAVGTALVALTALSAAMWAFSAMPAMFGKALLPLKTALLGLGAPVYAVIAVLGLLYAAYRANFGGMADYLSDIWKKITLTVKGVLAVFQSLNGGMGEIRGELATQIKAAGLTGLVTTISRIVARIQAIFNGFLKAVSSMGETVSSMFDPVRMVVSDLMQGIGDLFGMFTGNEVTGSVSAWESFGEVLGYVLAVFLALKVGLLAVQGVMVAVSAVTKAWTAAQWLLNAALNANPIGLLIIGITALIAVGLWLVQNWSTISAWWNNLWEGISSWAEEKWNAIVGTITGAWDTIVAGIAGFGASIFSGLQSVWDTVSGGISSAWDGYVSLLSTFWGTIVSGITDFGASLVGGIQDAWNSVLEFLNGLNLFESGAKLLDTFVEGIKSMASSVVDSVSGVLASVREYLPFSDAHTGPLSQLTLSGSRMMTTLAEGVNLGKGGLVASVSGALSAAGTKIQGWWESLTGGASSMETPSVSVPGTAVPDAPSFPVPSTQERQNSTEQPGESGNTTINITINGLSLPDVKNGEDFLSSLQSLVAEYGA